MILFLKWIAQSCNVLLFFHYLSSGVFPIYTITSYCGSLLFSGWVTIIPTRLYLISPWSAADVNLIIFFSKFISKIICSDFEEEVCYCIYSFLDRGYQTIFILLFFFHFYIICLLIWLPIKLLLMGRPFSSVLLFCFLDWSLRKLEEVSQSLLMLDMILNNISFTIFTSDWGKPFTWCSLQNKMPPFYYKVSTQRLFLF